MPTNINRPFTFDILHEKNVVMSHYDNHTVRRLSDLKGQFLDQGAFDARLAAENPILYEVFEIKRPEVAGEQLYGLSMVHPGKVGDEYNMTKGHFHAILDTGEVYYCLQGEGMMVMETQGGEWAVEALRPQKVLYVPPGWAHRSVNTARDETLVTFFVYPANAGHDYGSIEKQGFRKLVVERYGALQVIDNPRWLPPEAR
jgi:glucose-6-phosphate isomerase